MQAIRAVVIFMSILLVVGIGVLFYGIMNDWHKKGEDVAVVEASDLPSHAVAMPAMPMHGLMELEAFGDWEVALPAGAVIRDMESKHGMLFLRYVSGGRGGVIVLDLTKS